MNSEPEATPAVPYRPADYAYLVRGAMLACAIDSVEKILEGEEAYELIWSAWRRGDIEVAVHIRNREKEVAGDLISE